MKTTVQSGKRDLLHVKALVHTLEARNEACKQASESHPSRLDGHRTHPSRFYIAIFSFKLHIIFHTPEMINLHKTTKVTVRSTFLFFLSMRGILY